MLMRAAEVIKVRGYDVVGEKERFVQQNGGLVSKAFPDYSQTATWAKTAIDRMVSLGIVCGDGNGNLKPTNPVTKAEAATMLTKLFALR
jgi:hypothetical protein